MDITIKTTIRAMEHQRTQHWLDQSKISPLFGKAKRKTSIKLKKCMPFIRRTTFVGRHLTVTVDDRTPLLNNGIRPLRATKCIDVRIFSLGILFIGGVTVGGIMMYYEGNSHINAHFLYFE